MEPNDSSNPEETLFNAARVLPDPAQREAFLSGACQGDAALRQRVERLLADAGKAADYFAQIAPKPADFGPENTPTEGGPSGTLKIPNLPAPSPEAKEEGPGTIIGKYKLLQQIGEGGMGVVYMAEQSVPFNKRVALKIIKLGMDTKAVVARFEAERQALALMNHPNIAKVFDAGSTETGRPFFVMELIKGVPITEYCDKQKLSTKERLELFVPVCQAIQHAHQKGIIHRDIKPSNILVALFDGRPVPMVIDFGIAKATNQQLTQQTVFTNLGQLIGTPAYMSPEQAEGSQLDIDTRSDIYSLGVLLYELLTGTQPFPEKRLRSAGWAGMVKIIMEEEPQRPSTRLSTMTAEEQSQVSGTHKELPRKIGLVLRRELDWIVMACLEKDRSRRYDTANGLALDIARYLRGDAPEKAPPTWSYQFSKLARKHKKTFAMAAAIAVILTSATVFSRYQAVRAKSAEEVATKQVQKLGAINGWMNRDLLPQINPWTSGDIGQDRTIEIKLKDAILSSAHRLSEDFKDHPEIEGEIRLTIGTALKSLGMRKEAEANLRRAIELFKTTSGPEHTNTLKAQLNLGTMLPRQNEESGRLLEEVHTLSLKTLGREHLFTLECAIELGSHDADVKQDATESKLERAEVLFRELEGRFNRSGDEDPSIPLNLRIQYLQGLTLLRHLQGRGAERHQANIRLYRLSTTGSLATNSDGISALQRLNAEWQKVFWAMEDGGMDPDRDIDQEERNLKAGLEQSRKLVGDGWPTKGFIWALRDFEARNPDGDPEMYVHYLRLVAADDVRVFGGPRGALGTLRAVSGYYFSRLDWPGAATELRRQRTEMGITNGILLSLEALANHLAGDHSEAAVRRRDYFEVLKGQLGPPVGKDIDLTADRSALHPIMTFPCTKEELALLVRAVPEVIKNYAAFPYELREQVIPVTEGMLAFRQGQPEKAIRHLEPAMASAGNSPVNRGAHYVLAMAYEMAGRHGDALARLRHAEAILPDAMARELKNATYAWESVAMAFVLREEAVRLIQPPTPLTQFTKETSAAAWAAWREVRRLLAAGGLRALHRECRAASTNYAAAMAHPAFRWAGENQWNRISVRVFSVACALGDARTHLKILTELHQGLGDDQTTFLYELAQLPWDLPEDLKRRREHSDERKTLDNKAAARPKRQLLPTDAVVLGMCAYREGQYEKCIDFLKGQMASCREGLAGKTVGQTISKTFSAMAHWKLGTVEHQVEARRLLKEADERFFKTVIEPGEGRFWGGMVRYIMTEQNIKEADRLIDPGVVNAPRVAALPAEGWN